MNIQISQIILLVFALLFVWYIIKLRSVLSDRIILLIIAGGGMVLILFPELSSQLAHWIGIGRGVDMVFYFFILFSVFRFVGLSAEQRQTQRKLTDIVRAIAIQNAREGHPHEKSQGEKA